MSALEQAEVARVVELVASVPDPELPFLTISDLGILRSVDVEGGRVRVCVTPTYSGCPATETIVADIRTTLANRGYDDVEVAVVLAPAWTTDWLSERGRAALAEHGIAPPRRGPVPLPLPLPLLELSEAQRAGTRPGSDNSGCPRCGSTDTEELSRFGATACKALWRCRTCREPFEHFKAH